MLVFPERFEQPDNAVPDCCSKPAERSSLARRPLNFYRMNRRVRRASQFHQPPGSDGRRIELLMCYDDHRPLPGRTLEPRESDLHRVSHRPPRPDRQVLRGRIRHGGLPVVPSHLHGAAGSKPLAERLGELRGSLTRAPALPSATTTTAPPSTHVPPAAPEAATSRANTTTFMELHASNREWCNSAANRGVFHAGTAYLAARRRL